MAVVKTKKFQEFFDESQKVNEAGSVAKKEKCECCGKCKWCSKLEKDSNNQEKVKRCNNCISCEECKKCDNYEYERKDPQNKKLDTFEKYGVELYDNPIKCSDSMKTIVEKVINYKNIDFYRNHSSYLLYLSNELKNAEIDLKKANDENTKVFFKIKLSIPSMYIIYNVVERQTIEEILYLCQNKYRKSKTSIGYLTDNQEKYKLTNSTNRTSKTVFLYTIRDNSNIEETQISNDNSIVYTKSERIIDLENTICNLVQIPLCYLEPLAVVKYEEGNYFNIHHDGSFRRATFVIYLNDVNIGGETYFPKHNLSIKPIQGSAIFWNNNIHLDDNYAIDYCDNVLNEFHIQEQIQKEQEQEQKLLEQRFRQQQQQQQQLQLQLQQQHQQQQQQIQVEEHAKHVSNNIYESNINDNLSTVASGLNFYPNNESFLNKMDTYKKKYGHINYFKTTSELTAFLSDENNRNKYNINLVKDELGNSYIADMSMIHQGKPTKKENKYVINCFFNINRVRNT